MSRGGRGAGRGRGGRRAGPDITWDDEPVGPGPTSPEPLFPDVKQTRPRSLSPSEDAAVNEYLKFRDSMRDGPLYTLLEASSMTDEQGHVNERAGFSPFEGMPKYSARYRKARRSIPDLSQMPYVLSHFPRELRSTIDPKRTSREWETQRQDKSGAGRKRKRLAQVEDMEEQETDEDVVPSGRQEKKIKKDDPTKRKGQKRGLEAEDDYGPDIEEEGDDAEPGEEAEQDSAFSESDDGDDDDYNAERYFEDGERDDGDDGGGGEEDVL